MKTCINRLKRLRSRACVLDTRRSSSLLAKAENASSLSARCLLAGTNERPSRSLPNGQFREAERQKRERAVVSPAVRVAESARNLLFYRVMRRVMSLQTASGSPHSAVRPREAARECSIDLRSARGDAGYLRHARFEQRARSFYLACPAHGRYP